MWTKCGYEVFRLSEPSGRGVTWPGCCLDPAVSQQHSGLVFRGLNVKHSGQKLVHNVSLHRAINKRITCHGGRTAEQWDISVSVRQYRSVCVNIGQCASVDVAG